MICHNHNLNISVVQMSSTSELAANLQQVADLLHLAIRQKPDLVLLPENVLCHGTHDQIKKISRSISEWIDFLKAYTIENATTIVWGGIPVEDNCKLFNQSLVIDQTGKLITKYSKNHLFKLNGEVSETDLYSPGTEISVFTLKGWSIAMSICFDIRFPQLFQQYHFPDLILCPAAFTQKTGAAHWELLCRARAVENQCFLAAANQHTISPTPFPTFGHSIIVDPWGGIAEILPTGSGIISAMLRKERITEVRDKIPLTLK